MSSYWQINIYPALGQTYKQDVDYLDGLLGNKVLTAAGFILSVGTMWGEVTHFALLDALSTATGKQRGRANRRRRYTALCNRKSKMKRLIQSI